jgi:hypothetical protein
MTSSSREEIPIYTDAEESSKKRYLCFYTSQEGKPMLAYNNGYLLL